MNPGSGFKVYAMLPPEPQVPSQHLPGPWVSFLWPLSLTREGNDQLISYRWTSGRLKRALSFCSGPALAGGQKEWGGRGRGDPSHWLPGHDITRRWMVGKQTSPSPSYIHPQGGGEPQDSPNPSHCSLTGAKMSTQSLTPKIWMLLPPLEDSAP